MTTTQKKQWIVCMGGEDWWYHTHAHFDIQVMKSLSSKAKILYICSIGMRMPSLTKDKMFWARIKRKLKSISHMLQQVTPEFYVYSPIPLPLYEQEWGRRLNELSLRTQIRAVYLRLGIKNPLIWVNTPTGWPIVKPWSKCGLVYQRTDDYAAYDFDNFNSDYIRQLDTELLEKANLSVHVSDELHAQAKEITPHSILVDQGVDNRFFTYEGEIPSDMRTISGPILGYVGAMDSHKFDTPLIAGVAKKLPDCSIVLIGHSSPNVEELRELPNIHFLGVKTHEEIIGYMHNFDVCLLPTAQTEWGLKCRPLKLMEYLATGKPVVATPTPASAPFSKVISIGGDSESWTKAIQRIISREEDNVTEGAAHSLKPWDVIANDLWQNLQSKNIVA